jgi:hypothetical protein
MSSLQGTKEDVAASGFSLNGKWAVATPPGRCVGPGERQESNSLAEIINHPTDASHFILRILSGLTIKRITENREDKPLIRHTVKLR